MSISSGMRDERFSPYRLDDLNRFYRMSVARCSSIRLYSTVTVNDTLKISTQQGRSL